MSGFGWFGVVSFGEVGDLVLGSGGDVRGQFEPEILAFCCEH